MKRPLDEDGEMESRHQDKRAKVGLGMNLSSRCADDMQHDQIKAEPESRLGQRQLAIQDSKLLALPGELITMIYEWSLVEAPGNKIQITRDLKPPPLLSACRRIRNDAKAIWLEQNRFEITIRDCDASILDAFYRRLYGVGRPHEKKFAIALVGRKKWSNLKQWCKAISTTRAVSVTNPPATARHASVVAAAHEIAHAHQGSWTLCEQTLESLRRAVFALDPSWEV